MFISKNKKIEIEREIDYLKRKENDLKAHYWKLEEKISIICQNIGIEIITLPAKTTWKIKEKK